MSPCARRWRWLAALAVLLAPACRRAAVLPADIPAEIDHLAVLELDPAGRLLEASPIARFARGEALPLVTDDHPTALVGWSAATLERWGVRDEAVDPRAPLQAVVGCQPHLPAPGFAVRWAGGALETLDPAALPTLGASWLERSCPDLSDVKLELDDRCTGTRCALAAMRAGCTYALDLTSCGLGHVAASVDPEGRVCLDLSGSGRDCVPREGDTSSAGPYVCTEPPGCGLDVYLASSGAAPPFELARATPFPAPLFLPETVRVRGAIPAPAVVLGHALDLAVNDGRVFVTGMTGEVWECYTRPTALVRLEILDADSLERVGTSTLGACADRVLADPLGPGVLGTILDVPTGTWSLVRYDADGQPLASRTSTVTVAGAAAIAPKVIVPLGDPPELAVIYGAEQDLRPAVVVFHDAATLAKLGTVEIGTLGEVFSAAAWGPTALVLAGNSPRSVGWLDAATHTWSGQLFLEDRLSLRALLGVFPDAARGRTLVLGQGSSSLLAVTPEGGLERRASFEDAASVSTAVAWPRRTADGSTLLLVAGTTAASPDVGWTPEVFVSFFDPAALRFLPGSFEIGRGLASRILPDRRGRLFVLLPWAGEVVRLTPR